MSRWSGTDVARALGLESAPVQSFASIRTDTRTLEPGALFVALEGERFDAHDFLDAAKRAGASGAVVRRGTPPLEGLPLFEVDDTLDALGRLGAGPPPASPWPGCRYHRHERQDDDAHDG